MVMRRVNEESTSRINVDDLQLHQESVSRINIDDLQLHQSFRHVCIQLGAIFNITINRIKKGTRESAIPNR